MVTAEEIRSMLKKELETKSASVLAKEIHTSTSYLSQIVHGHRPPSKPILDHFHLKEVTVYVEK